MASNRRVSVLERPVEELGRVVDRVPPPEPPVAPAEAPYSPGESAVMAFGENLSPVTMPLLSAYDAATDDAPAEGGYWDRFKKAYARNQADFGAAREQNPRAAFMGGLGGAATSLGAGLLAGRARAAVQAPAAAAAEANPLLDKANAMQRRYLDGEVAKFGSGAPTRVGAGLGAEPPTIPGGGGPGPGREPLTRGAPAQLSKPVVVGNPNADVQTAAIRPPRPPSPALQTPGTFAELRELLGL